MSDANVYVMDAERRGRKLRLDTFSGPSRTELASYPGRFSYERPGYEARTEPVKTHI